MSSTMTRQPIGDDPGPAVLALAVTTTAVSPSNSKLRSVSGTTLPMVLIIPSDTLHCLADAATAQQTFACTAFSGLNMHTAGQVSPSVLTQVLCDGKC
eukprot:729319-Rhodomonas_salina.2